MTFLVSQTGEACLLSDYVLALLGVHLVPDRRTGQDVDPSIGLRLHRNRRVRGNKREAILDITVPFSVNVNGKRRRTQRKLLGKRLCFPYFQLALCTACIVIGAFINANLFGNMAVLLSAINRKAALFQEKLDTANTAMKNMKISSKLQGQV